MTAVRPRCSVPSAFVEIERCDELRSVVRRFMHAFASGDADAAINLTLPSEHLSWVGTDSAESWLGFDSISPIVRAQSIEVQGSQFTELESHAWTTGDTGWVTARYHALFPNGYESELRVTMIVVLHRATGACAGVLVVGRIGGDAFRLTMGSLGLAQVCRERPLLRLDGPAEQLRPERSHWPLPGELDAPRVTGSVTGGFEGVRRGHPHRSTRVQADPAAPSCARRFSYSYQHATLQDVYAPLESVADCPSRVTASH